jgi:hypothetical protein
LFIKYIRSQKCSAALVAHALFRGYFVCGKKGHIAGNCAGRKDAGSNVTDNNDNKNFNYPCKVNECDVSGCEDNENDRKKIKKRLQLEDVVNRFAEVF